LTCVTAGEATTLTGSSLGSPTHAGDDLLGDVRVWTRLAALEAVLAAPAGARERPLVQTLTALSERVLEALVRSGDEPSSEIEMWQVTEFVVL
jgi:hypothetical protein